MTLTNAGTPANQDRRREGDRSVGFTRDQSGALPAWLQIRQFLKAASVPAELLTREAFSSGASQRGVIVLSGVRKRRDHSAAEPQPTDRGSATRTSSV